MICPHTSAIRMKHIRTILISLPFVLIAAGMATQKDVGTYLSRKFHHEEIDAKQVARSLEMASRNIVALQREDGSFPSMLNVETRSASRDVNQYRQASGLWGLTQLHRSNPKMAPMESVEKGLDFYVRNIKESGSGKMIVFPGTPSGRTGGFAIYLLALTEVLREYPDRGDIRQLLEEHTRFLIDLRRDDGLFWSKYDYENGSGRSDPSADYDGAALLALTRAADLLNNESFRSAAGESRKAMWSRYVSPALASGNDDDNARSFYRWAALTVWELRSEDADSAIQATQDLLALSLWLKNARRFPNHSRNTSDAHVGLILAHGMAKEDGDPRAEDIEEIIRKGMWRNLRLQVGNPNQLSTLSQHLYYLPSSEGGAVIAFDSTSVRTDLSQKLLHSLLLLNEM